MDRCPDTLDHAVVLAAVKTLRAAKAVARRRAILDCRCARQHIARVGRDGRMGPIEQKDSTKTAAAEIAFVEQQQYSTKELTS